MGPGSAGVVWAVQPWMGSCARGLLAGHRSRLVLALGQVHYPASTQASLARGDVRGSGRVLPKCRGPFQPLLGSHLLKSCWLKHHTWPSPASRNRHCKVQWQRVKRVKIEGITSPLPSPILHPLLCQTTTSSIVDPSPASNDHPVFHPLLTSVPSQTLQATPPRGTSSNVNLTVSLPCPKPDTTFCCP